MEAKELAKLLAEDIEWLKDEQMGCCTHKLDDRLAVCVGWSDGFDENDETVIHAEDDPTWAIVAGVKVYTSDDMLTDFDFINFPYHENGDIEINDLSIDPEDDLEVIAKDLLDEYDSLKDLEIDETGLIIEKPEEEKVEVEEESLKEEKVDAEKELLANGFEKGECKSSINGNGICYYNYKGTGYFPEVVARLQDKVGKLDFVGETDKVVGIRHKDESLKEEKSDKEIDKQLKRNMKYLKWAKKRDSIDAEADNKKEKAEVELAKEDDDADSIKDMRKERAKKNFEKAEDDADADRDDKKQELKEAPVYAMEPEYDGRKSFYGKAHVDDRGNVKILYSYDTPVAMIKDGEVTLGKARDRGYPFLVWKVSQTTLRHVKEFLKQNGFKADSMAQMEKDYKADFINEALKEKCNKKLKEGYSVDIFEDLIDRAKSNIDDGYDIDEAIAQAIDDGLIYTDDIISLGQYYGVIDDSKIISDMYDDLSGDMYSRVEEYLNESLNESIEPNVFDKLAELSLNDKIRVLNLFSKTKHIKVIRNDNGGRLVRGNKEYDKSETDDELDDTIYGEIEYYYTDDDKEELEKLVNKYFNECVN